MLDFQSKIRSAPGRVHRKSVGVPAWLSKGKLIVALILFFGVAMFFVLQRVEYIRTEKRVRALVIQKRKLSFDLQALQLEERYRYRLDKIEQKARQELLLKEPEEKQIITIFQPLNSP